MQIRRRGFTQLRGREEESKGKAEIEKSREREQKENRDRAEKEERGKAQREHREKGQREARARHCLSSGIPIAPLYLTPTSSPSPFHYLSAAISRLHLRQFPFT